MTGSLRKQKVSTIILYFTNFNHAQIALAVKCEGKKEREVSSFSNCDRIKCTMIYGAERKLLE